MMPLTDRERREFRGVAARERALGQDVAELRRDQDAAFRAVERRLKLARGAIGTTHALDPATWAVVSVQQRSEGAGDA